MGCDSCEKKQGGSPVPFAAYESTCHRFSKIIKWLCIIVGVLMALLVATNAAWLWAWTGYDYESVETVTVDGTDGIANYINGVGDITNGADSN